MNKLKVIKGGLKQLEQDTFEAFLAEDVKMFTEKFSKLSKGTSEQPQHLLPTTLKQRKNIMIALVQA